MAKVFQFSTQMMNDRDRPLWMERFEFHAGGIQEATEKAHNWQRRHGGDVRDVAVKEMPASFAGVTHDEWV